MSAVAEAYGHICVALDTQPKLLSFLTDQVVEWGRISVDRLDVNRSDNESSALLEFAVLPLPDGKELSLRSEKAMVLVAIYNARCRGRSPIDPWREKPPETKLHARWKSLIEGQAYDQDNDEFGLMTDDESDGDISTIKGYISDMIDAMSVGNESQEIGGVPLLPSSPTENLDDCYFKNDGDYLTAAYCSDNYNVTTSYLSIYAADECKDLDPPRAIKRMKVKIDDGEKTRSVYCYFRADMEEIDRRRTKRLNR
ncbi:MAG: hypothetical protein ACI8P0_006326 [Planctomycetaceae bacterium]